MKVCVQKDLNFVLQQINKPPRKGYQKTISFKYLFHIFMHDCPMLEYETMYELFVNLKVPINPTMNWFDSIY